MSYVVVDIESDGPCPPMYSMVSFGAVIVDNSLNKRFKAKTKPISEIWVPESLAISNVSREEHKKYDEPKEVMLLFYNWLVEHSKGKPIMISDNIAFDWQWINYYFHKYIGKNPFGYSGRRIGDIYCGIVGNSNKNEEWKKKYRKTKHTHDPLDDALGNAEALISFKKELGFKINFE